MHGNVDYHKPTPGKENNFYACEINVFSINNEDPILTRATIYTLLLDVKKLYRYKMQKLDVTRMKVLKSA